jgi:hypothetical protein
MLDTINKSESIMLSMMYIAVPTELMGLPHKSFETKTVQKTI